MQKIITLISVAILLPTSNLVHAEQSVRDLILKFQEVSDKPNEQGYQYLLQAIRLNRKTREVSADKEAMLRAVLMRWGLTSTFELHKRVGEQETCRVTHQRVVDLAPYAPTVAEIEQGAEDGDFEVWPVLLASSSVCYSNSGNLALAKVEYERAAVFGNLKLTVHRELVSTTLRMARTNIENLDPYRVGNYVTNTGLLQIWIGKIVAKNDPIVTVRFTYTSSDHKYRGKVGTSAQFTRDEVKPLQSISMEALLKGWQ